MEIMSLRTENRYDGAASILNLVKNMSPLESSKLYSNHISVACLDQYAIQSTHGLRRNRMHPEELEYNLNPQRLHRPWGQRDIS